MGALEGFLSTWDKARQTFGAGVPQSGEQFDQSAQLQQLQSTVQTAAPGSAWSGTAANAYGEVNKEHARVLGELAALDRRLANHVTESANVVATGRQNLDNLRQWVVDAAASVPPGKNREQLILPIVQKGLGELSGIVSTSNSELNRVAGDITKLGNEWDALQDQKFGGAGKEDKPEQRDDEVQLVSDEEALGGDGATEENANDRLKREIDEGTNLGSNDGASLADGQLTPEESQRLKDAASLSADEKADLNNGSLTIPPHQMAYLNGLSSSLDGKSPAEIKSILAKLPPSEAQAVSNALHIVGSDKVHTEGASTTLKPGEHGYVPLNGGKDNLPQSIQSIFDAPLIDSQLPEQKTLPDGRIVIDTFDPNKPYNYLDEYRDIAAIAEYGDPSLQRGSALNDGLLAESRELLENFESKDWPTFGSTGWAHENLDPALQDMLSAASQDPIAVHEALAGAGGTSPNNEFIGDLLKHDWADDGLAAGTLFPDAADTSERAGQVMHAVDMYTGQNYQELLNIHDKQSLGQINPALTQALAQANIPYIDDMFNANVDDTKGFESLDGLNKQGGNANMDVTRGLFAVIDSDPVANKNFNGAATDLWKGYVSQYSDSLVNGRAPDAGALQAAGYLQRMMDQGEFLNQYDQTGDKQAAATAAQQSRALWYDTIHDGVGLFPKVGDVISVYDALPGDPLRDFFVGAPPNQDYPNLPAKNINEVIHLATAYAAAKGAGDLAILDQYMSDGVLDPFNNNAGATTAMTTYLSALANGNDMGFNLYTSAYGTGLTISDDELEELKNAGS